MPDNNSSSGAPGSQHGNQGGQKPTLSWSQPVAAKPANGAVKTEAPVTSVKATPLATTAKESSSNLGSYVGIFVAGLIIGALIGWGITAGKSGNTPTATTATSTTTGTSATTSDKGSSSTTGSTNTTGGSSAVSSGGNVTLASTEQAGFAVAVEKATVSKPTWLVVYEDHNGTPGNAIGAGLFFPGTTSGTIQLLRATLPGQSYFVGQSLDDGDKLFSLQNDKPVRDAQGNPLFTQFTAK